MTMPAGPLSTRVAALCQEVGPRLAGQSRTRVLQIRRRLDEPLRVAVAGSLQAGMSSLDIALTGRRVRDLIVVDTPGLSSATAGISGGTRQYLFTQPPLDPDLDEASAAALAGGRGPGRWPPHRPGCCGGCCPTWYRWWACSPRRPRRAG